VNFPLHKHLILNVTAGSHAYGTNTDQSDHDTRGVVIPPKEYFLGIHSFEQHSPDPRSAQGDLCYYDIRKFVRLAMKGNPNILEMLKAPVITITKWGNELKALWPHFLSRRLVTSHIGMATAHLKRLDRPDGGIKSREAIEQHGFNTKDASHVIRVLGQCMEILTLGTLTLPRPEATKLVDIRQGRTSRQAIEDKAKFLIDYIRDLALVDWPDHPDEKALSCQVVCIVEDFHRENPEVE
jgi:predicted nucleotidyltransferase